MVYRHLNIRKEERAKELKRIKVGFKKGDAVTVLSGDDKRKEGEVLKVSRKKYLVLVKGINLKQKVVMNEDRTKSFKKMEFPIDISNVMLTSRYNAKKSGKKVSKKA